MTPACSNKVSTEYDQAWLVMFIMVQGSTVVNVGGKNVVLDHGKDLDTEKIIVNIFFIVVMGAAGYGIEMDG